MKRSKFLNIEIIFSIFIIIIIGAIITFICLRINYEKNNMISNSEATIIITNILENIKSRRYSDIKEYIDGISDIGITKKIEENGQYIIVNGNIFENKFFGTEIPKGYIVELRIDNLNNDFNIQKSINIDIKYKINNENKNLSLSTVVEKEHVEECNKPEIENDYLELIGVNLDEYEVIPIKYSNKLNSYVITTAGDEEWYNYSSKEWARVLIFSKDGEDLKNQFISNDGIVKKQIKYNDTYELFLNNYMYVWIPNFTIKDNISYFRYGSGKNSIRQDLLYNNGEYLYLNIISDVVNDISEECNFNGVSGVWKKVIDSEDIYFKNLNSSKYGPINNH